MFVVGLTGGIGSGKSAVSAMFAELGAAVVDTDLIAHQLSAAGSPLLGEIAHALGSQSIKADGTLDRHWLRQRIFTDPAARRALEDILHPKIRAAVAKALALPTSAPYQIVVVPLLFEAGGYDSLIQRRLVVDCDEVRQIERAMRRSQLSEAEVCSIISTQMPRKQRLTLADDIIKNDGTLEELRRQVQEKHEKYIKACMVSQSIS